MDDCVMTQNEKSVKRILIVDDNPSIHDDLKHILVAEKQIDRSSETLALEKELFDDIQPVKNDCSTTIDVVYTIDDAYQGEEALRKVEEAEKEGLPYTLIFMDVRMPPGMDGIQTIQKIWEKYPHIEIVICTAYSDYSWDEIVKRFGSTDQLYFMKKPFDSVTVRQAALSLTTKWEQKKKSKSHIDILEAEIAQRTQQLNDMLNYLKQLKEKVEGTIITRSDFLAHISHILQSALNGILGMTDMLLDTDLDNEQRDYTETIKTSGKSLNMIVSNILDYSTLESGKVGLEKIEFNVRTAVENVVDLISECAYEKSLEIGVCIDADVPETLLGDALYLRQILLNLINNAIKFTAKGNVIVSVYEKEQAGSDADTDMSWRCSDNNNKTDTVMLRFDVTDTGQGLTSEQQEHIFSEIRDEDTGKDQHSRNTRLGLKVCRQLTELMKGSLHVESEKGKGSRFSLVVPFKIVNSPRYKKMVPAHSIKDIRCLIVGDNPTNRKVLSLHITKWGGICDEVGVTEDIVDKLHTALYTAPFAIVIVDLKNGDIQDYHTIAQQIRRHKNLDYIHLISITAQAKRGDIKIYRESGYSAYLTKPIKLSHLYNCLLMINGFREKRCSLSDTDVITKHFIDECSYDCFRIIVIDDVVDNQNYLVCLLNKLQIRCDMASSVSSAVKALEKIKYDMILVHAEMNDENSFEPVKYIMNKVDKEHRIPIITIIVEEDVDKIKADEYFAAGITDYITIPFNMVQITDKLKKYLKGK